MTFHIDPVVDDIVTTIVNDGNGDQCGLTYDNRCRAAKANLYIEFRWSVRNYARRRMALGHGYPNREQIIDAADTVMAYYRQHLKEVA